jgi:hypothetical protein
MWRVKRERQVQTGGLLLVGSLLALTVMGGLGVGQIGTAHAGTTSGSGVTVSGLDALANTVDTYSKGNMGKMLGIGLGLGGMLLMGGGRLGIGGLAAMAGVGAAFVPNVIGTAFDATAAAPLLGLSPGSLLTAWWAPMLGLLYPAMLVLRGVLDPVVWLGVTLGALLRRRRPGPEVSTVW